MTWHFNFQATHKTRYGVCSIQYAIRRMLKAPTEAPPRKSVGKPAAKKAPKTPAKMHTPAKRAPKAANPRSATTANATGEHLKGRQHFREASHQLYSNRKTWHFY